MIPLPSKPKAIEKNKEGNKALFEIEALYPGYGVTIGNSLRRVLLSSFEGAAVTKVKIEDVGHEFSTISGVMEDVITIILNLKNLRFRSHSDEAVVAKLRAKGEGEVKGSSITVPTQIELVNPDCHIATITDKKTSLNMEIEIEKGTGYSSAEDRKEEKLEVGQIIIDSIFTPIRGANFYVENMRVGKRTDFDKLFLEIETDGTITPEDAFFNAVDILLKHFSLFASFDEKKEAKEKSETKKTKKEKEEENKEKKEDKKEEKKSKKEDSLAEELYIEDLDISVRTQNILKEGRVKTVKGILKKKEEGIANIKGMGEKGVEEIKKALKKKKIELN